jgi:hypothetical protein
MNANAAVWDRAAEIDKSIAIKKGNLKSLSALRLIPQNYSRDRLFVAMVQQRPLLLKRFPLASVDSFFHTGTNPATKLRQIIGKSVTTLTRVGQRKRIRYLRVYDVIDLWEQNTSLVSANDVFFRTLKLDRKFDCSALSDFNVLPTGSSRAKYLEVATLLMGTSGCMTDSHSDDPDGCNYCITGKKLWLVWDRREGQRRGLEDCEYDDVYSQAAFDLDIFTSMKSARWFTISRGQTLFLPGNFTHKVLTLERYLGISSFYVGLPNALSSLSRWILRGTIMIKPQLRKEIATLIVNRLRLTARADRKSKNVWGFYHLGDSYQRWQTQHNAAERTLLLSDPSFRIVVETIRRVAAL